MRRKKVDETTPRVIQEEVERFVKLGSLGNQLSGCPSKMRMKQTDLSHFEGETRTLRIANWYQKLVSGVSANEAAEINLQYRL